MQRITEISDRVIYISYLALAIATPLIFTTKTTEIYEVPKMFFVYFVSTIVLFATLLKFTLDKKIKLPTNLPTIAFGIFLLSQTASTITSTDTYTSIFGYPTRLNGGLLSTISYLILFVGAQVNLNTEKIKNIILATIFSAVAISLWGIPSHFGYDPSCLVLTGKLNSSCWLKDFDPALRIFSTLGQPNWLSSYLVLILPLAFTFAFLYKTQRQVIFAASSILIYWAIILTNSRAGLIGLALSLIVAIVLLGKQALIANLKIFAIMILAFVVITFSFADFIAGRLPQTGAEQSPGSQGAGQEPAVQTSQTLGTESGRIRLIVWRGALDIWRNWPILGSGPETFVSAYYLYRPSAHNQTSEWEYFYNKAHNEFLNYLSTTGAVGFSAYALLLLSIVFEITRFNKKDAHTNTFQKAAVAGILGYLVTIFFGFSTVATQTTFIILTTSAIGLGSRIRLKEIDFKYLDQPLYKNLQVVFVLLVFAYCLTFFARLYFEDATKKRAESLSGPRALIAYKNATTIAPMKNPYLLADFAYDTAAYLKNVGPSENKETLVRETKSALAESLKLAPSNYLITQKIAKAYIILTESENVTVEAKQTAEKLSLLAPNYPPAYLTKAQIFVALGDRDTAFKVTQEALSFKPEYLEAQKLLDQLTISP